MKAFDRIAVRTEVLETISVYYKAIKENRVKDVVFYSESTWSTKSPDILQLPSGTGESYGVHTSYKNYIKDIYDLDFEATLNHKENIVDRGFSTVTIVLKSSETLRIDLTKLRKFLAGQIVKGKFRYFN